MEIETKMKPFFPYGKIILDLCGDTGAWSKPYADAGYDVAHNPLIQPIENYG